VGRQVWDWARFLGKNLGTNAESRRAQSYAEKMYRGHGGAILHETRYAELLTRAETFSSKLCSMSGNTNHMTTGTVATGRLGTLGALLRPENYLLVLFAISTTLWTVAFLFYFLSAQLGAFVATIARAARLRRARA
jgi:hypothetical protein